MYNCVRIEVSVLVLQSVEKTNFVLALNITKYIVTEILMDANGIHTIVHKTQTVPSTQQSAQSSPMERM